jgi:hypothetical protein
VFDLVAESGNSACRYLAEYYNTLVKVRATPRRVITALRHQANITGFFDL